MLGPDACVTHANPWAFSCISSVLPASSAVAPKFAAAWSRALDAAAVELRDPAALLARLQRDVFPHRRLRRPHGSAPRSCTSSLGTLRIVITNGSAYLAHQHVDASEEGQQRADVPVPTDGVAQASLIRVEAQAVHPLPTNQLKAPANQPTA